MPLYTISEAQMRDGCKRAIEGLELWLRRLIDTKLIEAYGQNYLDAQKADGSRVINSSLANTLAERRAQEPARFVRAIDAAFLADQIQIICNPALYREHFADALNDIFPQGNDSARTFLSRLVAPRNALSHANPISVHDAYRVLCYSMDVVEGLKAYYARVNMANLYNVPTVVRILDSLGHLVYLSSSNRSLDGPAIVDYSRDEKSYLRCGDSISITAEVDPAFRPDQYEVEWSIANVGGPRIAGEKFQMVLSDRYVSTRFCVVCRVKSNQNWHKLGSCDDQIDIAYKVLPPI
jgi:hypothetical protein